ncbi:hypothetical protein BJ944DRAFT_267532 [Cunninghamella echinulata]|nr:hypothetical protein BJ944DRAFT_267532 [Cunninghamella echinulata]
MLLFELPYELLDSILDHVPQKTLTRLCTVNQQGYELCLPHLYRHLHIKNRSHFKQLEKGLKRSTFLQQVVANYTRTLTIGCEQSSYQWLISNHQASWCQTWLKNIHTITFSHFDILPVEQISSFLYRFSSSSLHNLHFHYCNLICQNQPEPMVPMLPDLLTESSIFQLPATYTFQPKQELSQQEQQMLLVKSNQIKRVEFLWTDFSSTAITTLFSMLPQLSFVNFGANHNRLEHANSIALKALKQHCSHITGLHIRLQQIEKGILSDTITHYGHQLINLGIQCQDKHVLQTVAKHATNIEQLTLHASLVNQSSDDEEGEKDDEEEENEMVLMGKSWRDQRSSSPSTSLMWRTDYKNNYFLNKNEKKTLDNIIGVVQKCGRLIYMEMVSWGVQDIPSILFEIKDEKQQHSLSRCSSTTSLSSLASSSTLHSSSSSSLIHNNKTSLTLDSEVLNEIRTLFI